MAKCDICKKEEMDIHCEIVLTWKEKENRGIYHTCIFCWDDLQNIFRSESPLPFSGNTLNVSLKN